MVKVKKLEFSLDYLRKGTIFALVIPNIIYYVHIQSYI